MRMENLLRKLLGEWKMSEKVKFSNTDIMQMINMLLTVKVRQLKKLEKVIQFEIDRSSEINPIELKRALCLVKDLKKVALS